MAKEIDFLASDDEFDAVPARTVPVKTGFTADLEDDADNDAAFIAAAAQKHNVKAGTQVAKQASKAKSKAKVASGIVSGGGSFQSMGLHPSLLRSLLLRGFTTPTPIQRRAIPAILAQPPQDVVAMARTGSGKTLSYIVPLIQRLNGRHSTSFGIKSIILCPSRELALQILKVGKDLARGWRSDDDARGEAIRWALIVGGEGLDEQFAIMTSNPDVVIATPGRLLHLVVEMNLDLKSVDYVVFDEADRLFEMGFADQLEELLRRLPSTRQTLLFSATLPKSLVEFARAGLETNPKLIRLDADQKISPDLRMAFFSVKPAEKEAALLYLLREVIRVPTGEHAEEDEDSGSSKKRKRLNPVDQLRPYQTIIFCATKHHVEYLLLLLTTMGYACSHIYSSLDQAARSIQMNRFRAGRTSLLIVTDLAARGIDLPVLEHVVNYDFPPQARIFVHRVGRTARAGRRGWAWSLCTHTELPYLCDLQLFLARPLVSSHTIQQTEPYDLHSSMVLGTFPREALDEGSETIRHAMQESSATATAYEGLVGVVKRAHTMYMRSQPKASSESYRRTKDMLKAAERSAMTGTTGTGWALAGHPLETAGVHDVLQRPDVYQLASADDVKRARTHADPLAGARAALLAKVNAFRPGETVFEMGARGQQMPLARLMQDRRRTLDSKQQRARAIELAKAGAPTEAGDISITDDMPSQPGVVSEAADEDDIASVFDTGKSFRDPSVYMDYEQRGAAEERGYSLGTSFAEQAKHVAVDMGGDDIGPGHANQRPNQRRWDTKKKKFVMGDGTGSDNQKLIRTETGLKLPASFRSGRFDEWRKTQKVELPHVGEDESAMPASARRMVANVQQGGGPRRRGFFHTQTKAPKPLDKLQYDYKKKKQARERKGGKGMAQAKNELKSARQIQRERETKEKRRAKNARPTKRRR
ncbi:dead-domain-containing protein [Malassezia pachydermatis]|uniref:RNA helicase n=1 Tax=Malassezia pachydermatis TaxID=77020 RepID=A0A0M8MNT7_9BASI|nr:dead-domain-containing protein [Malassezia pachydermatis]KOS15308.1 dead-domain-containing protein [Malassezia pachydermatis]